MARKKSPAGDPAHHKASLRPSRKPSTPGGASSPPEAPAPPSGHRHRNADHLPQADWQARANETDAELGRILENSLNEVYLFDAQSLTFLLTSRGARENLGYTKEELRTLTPPDLKPPHPPEVFAELLEPLRSGREEMITFESIHRRKNGSSYDVEVNLQMGKFQGHPCFVAVVLDITERKKTETELRRLSKVFAASVDAIIVKDLSGRIVDINAAAERQYGWTREELLGKSIKVLVPPEQHSQRDELMARCLRGEEVRSVKALRVTKSGEVLPVLLTLSLLTDEKDQPAGMVSIAEDITELHGAEQALQASEIRFRSAFDDAAVGMALQDAEGRYQRVNPALCKLLGYQEDELIGRSYREITHPADLEKNRRLDEVVVTRESPSHRVFKKRFRHKDGHFIWALTSASTVCEPDGTPSHRIVHVQSIDPQVEAEAALRESEQRYRFFVEQTNDGFYRLDFDPPIPVHQSEDELIRQMYERGFIAECNNTFAHMYGYESGKAMTGMPLVDLHGGSDVPENVEALRRFVRGGFRHRDEETIEFGSDGRVIHLTNNSVGIIEDDLYVSCWGTQSNITERKELEQEVINAAEEERQRIAHDLHDDLGSLLTGIKLRIEALQATLAERDSPNAEHSKAIAELIRDAIAKTRGIALGLNPVGADPEDLASALRSMSGQVESTTKLRCRFHYPEPLPIDNPIAANHLFRIAQEAVNNAVKHSGASSIRITLRRANHSVVLKIADDGSGFDFEAGKGEGLGLHTMSYRTRALRGTLGLKSGSKTGTTVICTVPWQAPIR